MSCGACTCQADDMCCGDCDRRGRREGAGGDGESEDSEEEGEDEESEEESDGGDSYVAPDPAARSP